MSMFHAVRTSISNVFIGTVIASLTLALAGSANAALIISQYYEGANSDKFIEIFNTGPNSVDLGAAEIRVGLWSNANRELWKTSVTPGNNLPLTGTLAANSSYLIRNTGAAAPPYAVSGANLDNINVINFNGDDSVVLYSGATYSFANVIDAFGVTANSFVDTSYVRNVSVTSGTNADFNAAEWTQFSLASVASATATSNERLGFHAIPEPTTLALAGLGLFGFLALARCRRLA
jgi:predicted extracellular nuclease